MRVYDPKTSTPQVRALRERAEFETREVLSKYDHLNVFSQRFEEELVHTLFKEYWLLIPRRRTLQQVNNFGCRHICTLSGFERKYHKRLASLAIGKYNEKGKGQWDFEELISLRFCNNCFRSYEYYICFGARSISSEDLEPFEAHIYHPRDKTDGSKRYIVKRVDPLRNLDEIESSSDKGEQLDESTVRDAEQDKIRSSDEKDKLVDEGSMGMN